MEILDTADLTMLVERVAQARTLREHHVWEAARCLSIDLRDHQSSSSTRRFAELVAAGAMLDAVMLLTTLSEPRRVVTSIRNVEGRWLCTIQHTPVPMQKAVGTCKAEHADLPAAVLMSFLLSLLKSRRDSPRGTALPQQQSKKRLEHHDT